MEKWLGKTSSVSERIIDTTLLQHIKGRTLAQHGGNPMIAWSGPSRVGKTTAANTMVAAINERADQPAGFRAHRYEVGEIRTSAADQKRMLRSVYHACVGRLNESRYRYDPIEDLVTDLVRAFEVKNLQVLFLDEAGGLSVGALRGLTLLRDRAEELKWPLSLILIGMDDLPARIRAVEQVYNRFQEWCYFEPFELEDTWQLVQAIHPYFARLERGRPEHEEQVEYIHNYSKGLPGSIVPYLRRFDYWLSTRQDSRAGVTMSDVRAAATVTDYDRKRIFSDAELRFRMPSNQRSGRTSVGRSQSPESPKESPSRADSLARQRRRASR